jgi:hypothetical protein
MDDKKALFREESCHVTLDYWRQFFLLLLFFILLKSGGSVLLSNRVRSKLVSSTGTKLSGTTTLHHNNTQYNHNQQNDTEHNDTQSWYNKETFQKVSPFSVSWTVLNQLKHIFTLFKCSILLIFNKGLYFKVTFCLLIPHRRYAIGPMWLQVYTRLSSNYWVPTGHVLVSNPNPVSPPLGKGSDTIFPTEKLY